MSNQAKLIGVYDHILYPFKAERARGNYLFDEEGNAYLDFYGGICVNAVGHNPPKLIEAIHAQANKLFFTSNHSVVDIREEAASKLVDFASNELRHVFFCNSGAEANENALKTAIKQTARAKIVAYKGAFHGRTTMALSATDIPKWHQQMSGWVGPVERIEPNNLGQLSKVDETAACVILEPIQSIGGVVEFQTDYLKALRKRCDEVGAYLIFDEVQTGMGRTGVPVVAGHCGITPDIASYAKALGGGFPVGATMVTDAVNSKVECGDLGATFGGNPLACVAVIATIETIEEGKLIDQAVRIEESIRANFRFPQIKEIRGKGCLLGLLLDRPAKPVYEALFKEGVIVGTTSNPDVLHLLPPYTVGESEIELLHQALGEVLGHN